MRLLLIFYLINVCYSQRDGSFWWLKNKRSVETPVTETIQVSSTSTSSEHSRIHVAADVVCCECVPFFLCENGTIITDGGGALDLRIGAGKETTPAPAQNVEVCPNSVDICCLIPDFDPSCLEQPTTEEPAIFTPHPESECECLPHMSCDADLVVSDGQGITSIELSNGRVVSHSKCPHALDVCCFLPTIDIDIGLSNLTSQTAPPIMETTDSLCECVPPILCGPDGFIKTDGAGVLDVRIGSRTPPKACPQNPNLVCCRIPEPEVETSTEPLTQSSDSTTSPKIKVPPLSPPCGQRNFNGIGVRILGFKEGQTQFGEYPWVATLLQKEFMNGTEIPLFVGGASLIHRRVAMTAAHKIEDIPVQKLMVRLGEWDVASTKESHPYQSVDIEKVIIHPGYTPGPLFHDIALLILKEDAKLDYHINPICPAKSLSDIDPSTCVTNGWGVDAFSSNNYQAIMKSVKLPLVEKATCQALLRKTRLSRYFNLHSSFICAGGEGGVDSCKGDGGGPLACQSRENPSRYFQVGITAWGIGCGEKDVPGVYADVVFHYPWIMEQVNTLFPKSLTTEPLTQADVPTTTLTESTTLSAAEKRKQRRKERRKQRQERRKQRQEQNKERREQRRRIEEN